MTEAYEFTKAKIAAEGAARRKQTRQRAFIYLVAGLVGAGVGYLIQGYSGAVFFALAVVAPVYGFEVLNRNFKA